jgi:hypothetical protein
MGRENDFQKSTVMSHEPERRRQRSAAELRAQREELQRQWNARQQHRVEQVGEPQMDGSPTMAKSPKRRPDHSGTTPSRNDVVGTTETVIARRAFELYETRGGEHGHDLDDWLQAERELRPALRVGD